MKKYALLKIDPDLHHALKLKALADKTTLVALGNRAVEKLLAGKRKADASII